MTDKKRIMMIRPGKRFARMAFGQPLGLLGLISILRKHFPDTFEINLTEQAPYNLKTEDVAKIMAEFKPDLVLFSCMSLEANELRELAGISKSLFPDVQVWLGGPHATFLYDWELEAGNIDAACIGEGEETFREMVRAWLDDRPLDDVAGLALIREGRVVTTAERPLIEDLDSLPLPAWDMIDFNKYALQPSMNTFEHSTPWALLFTSRACPYQCIYCHSIFGKKIRHRGVDNVMRELEILVDDHAVREIHIVDDIFNFDLSRAKTICDEIVSRGIKVKIAFPNGLRGDRMDRELIKKLKAAGCYCITYAVETGSLRLQKRIKKNLDLDKVREVIAWTDEEGIIASAFFMLGFPGETMEELKMTVDFALGTRLIKCLFFTVVVYPRTGLYEMAKQEYPDFDFSEYDDNFHLRYFSEVPFFTKVSGIDIYKFQRDTYRAFYLRPSIIAKILIRFPKNMALLAGMYYGVRAVITSVTKMETYFLPARQWISRNLGILKM